MAENQTNPAPVVITPVSNTTTMGTSSGSSAAPLASGARVATAPGRIPTTPTPITSVRRKAFVLLLAAFLAAPLMAQTAHTDVLTWTASVTNGTTINVYRAAGSCASNPTAFVQIATGVVAGGPYTDASPLVGVQCYYVTAALGGVESIASNKVTLTSTVPLQPPTGLAGTAN
jgi:hypothetical protein